MNFSFDTSFFILLGLLIIGFGVVAWVLMRLNKRVDVLFGGKGKDEAALQEGLVRRMVAVESRVGALEPRTDVLEQIARVSVQKVGFVRFNPFHDTGGDNSFVLALLDHDNNGVLVSSLYTREGVRTYGKKIEQGRTRYPLIDEEKKMLEETIK